MLTSFVLTMAIAAPVPPAAPPVPSGPVPRILELKPDADGKIMVTVTRTEMVQAAAAPVGGAAPGAPANVAVNRLMTVELSDVKELKVTTADGTKLDTAEAIKKLAGGAAVVVSADGKPVSPNYLKLFKDDVLVLASPELIGLPTRSNPIRPGGPIMRPVPAPVPAQPGVVQIQIQAAVPAQPAPAPAPKPEK